MHPFTIGIIASRNKVEYEYFTSAQFPILVEEELAVGAPAPQRGALWSIPIEQLGIALPAPVGANLQVTVVYQTYSNWPTENLAIAVPVPVSANLQATIVYQTYNNWPTENVSVGVPTPISASLPTVVSYVNYNNALAVESLSIGIPQVISGTLT